VDRPPLRVAFFDIGDTLVETDTRRWVPGAKEALDALRAQELRLGVISNTGTLTRAELAPLLPVDFDWRAFAPELVILSSEVGVAKPNPEIFRRALAAAGSTAAECLFCTESLIDALVAQRVGMMSARVQPPPNADVGGLVAALAAAGVVTHPSA
jgi:putative hydrolase of the HAD superfamily